MHQPTEFDFFYGIDAKFFCYGYGVMVLGRISKHLSSKFPNKTRLYGVRSGNLEVNCTIDYLFNTVSHCADLSSADLILKSTYSIISTGLRQGTLSVSKQMDDTY